MRKESTFVIPNKECLKAFGKWFTIVLSAFVAVYYTTNSLAAARSDHYHMYTDLELLIPLVPPMIIIYMSYVLVFGLILFVLKSPQAIKGLAYAMLATIGISGLIFFLFPGHLGFTRPETVPGYELMFDLLYILDKPHNLYPSLHIAFASLCVLCIIHQTNNKIFQMILKAWYILVCASVILVHQHHLFDIFSGVILGVAVYKLVYLRVMEEYSFNSLEKRKGVQTDSAY